MMILLFKKYLDMNTQDLRKSMLHIFVSPWSFYKYIYHFFYWEITKQSLSITSVLRSRQLHGLLKLNVLGFNIFISSNSDLKEKLVMDFSPLYLYHSSDAFYYLWPLTGASWFPGLFRTALNSALHINQISAP